MSRKREMIFMGMGILAGLALCGSTQAANVALTAAPTSQTFYVDGQRIQFEAYAIHGNNFVKLRDIGKAVDFGVEYNAADNSVHIDPNAPYTEEVTAPAPTQTSPSAPTEESVRAVLQGLRDAYPSGSTYPTPYLSTSNGPYSRGTLCSGWATLCSDAAFGNLPWRKVEQPAWDQIRTGDLVRYDTETSGHVVVVVSKTDEYIKTTESGTGNMVRWGGQYFKWWLESQTGYTLYTRYPN